jgi:hypothetical protein
MGKATLALLLGLTLVACGGGATDPSGPTSGSTGAPKPEPTPTPVPTPTPTPTPPGQTLTGVWQGTFNETIAHCDVNHGAPGVVDYTLRLDLTQSDSNVSGAALAVVDGRYCNDAPGARFKLTVSGSAGAAAVLLHLAEDHGSADFTGTVSGNTMGGTLVTNEGGTGTWSATR